MATVTPIKTFVSGEIVTPDKLNQLSIPTVTINTGEVTPENLSADVRLVPAGSIIAFGGASAPAGWLACDGQAVSRTEYASLYSAIGTTWGTGNGASTFNVPSLGDRYLRHKGATYSGAVGTVQTDLVKNHTHSGTTGNDTPDHTHTIYADNMGRGCPPGNYYNIGGAASQSGGASARHKHPFTTGNPDANGGTENRPFSATVLYCIKT